jgi:FkbM family methyltransferase
MLRPIKNLAKSALRLVAHWRLHHLPLSDSAADWWANTIRQYPAIFSDEHFRRRVCLDKGILMDVGLVDAIERELWLHGEWDRHVKSSLIAALQPGDTFLDLGANIGYFTLLASRLVGSQGTVIAVEPSIRALRKLTHHLWLNRCENVVLLSVAAGDRWERATLALANESNIGGSALLPAGATYGRTESALLAPIDDLLSSIDCRLRMVKIDLEGFELSALRGCRQLLERHRPQVVCEVTEKLLNKFGDSAGELVQFFQDLDYEVRSIRVPGGSAEIPDAERLSDPASQFDIHFAPRSSVLSQAQSA